MPVRARGLGGGGSLRPLRIWLPYVCSVAGSAAALDGLGSAGVGGLTAAAGWNLAKLNACATLFFTVVSAVQFGLYAGDGAQTARFVGGYPASSSSRAARAVNKVAKFMAAEPGSGCRERLPTAAVKAPKCTSSRQTNPTPLQQGEATPPSSPSLRAF